jgi:hypothetical protein
MIWLINHTDPLGCLLHALLQAEKRDCVAMTTAAMPRCAAVGQDQGQEVIWWHGARYAIDAMQFVYYGTLPAEPSPSIPAHHLKDWMYVTNAWQAWLRYVLARVPVSLGVLPDTGWIDTWRHLPVLAKRAPRYGMLAPVYHEADGIYHGQEYGYLSSYIVEHVASFTHYREDSILAVAIPDGYWLQCAWIGNRCYTMRSVAGHWEPYTLPPYQEEAIGRCSRAWGLSVAGYTLRQHKTGVIGLYGCSPRLDAILVSEYFSAIQDYLYKEYICPCY